MFSRATCLQLMPCCRHKAPAWFAALLIGATSAHAVLFVSTGDPEFNTTAPSGTLAGSGWDLQGTWGGFLGTPIAPNLFVTAKHTGGSVGQSFSFRGTAYTTVESFAHSASDLQIWKVNGTFGEWAPLYTDVDEPGKSLVVFGRGTQRGAEVRIEGGIGGDFKGWRHGTADGRMRWGENVVATVANGGAGLGELLQMNFDLGGGINEAHLSSGDSGGGVFIQQDGIWKLAGINYGIHGPFKTTSTSEGFSAALVDVGGLSIALNGGWFAISDQEQDQPSSWFATRISSNAEWIASVAVPEPSEYMITLGGFMLAFAAIRAIRRRSNAATC